MLLPFLIDNIKIISGEVTDPGIYLTEKNPNFYDLITYAGSNLKI